MAERQGACLFVGAEIVQHRVLPRWMSSHRRVCPDVHLDWATTGCVYNLHRHLSITIPILRLGKLRLREVV